jgi:dinuclear metal center YbgI/SA1388 family protein
VATVRDALNALETLAPSRFAFSYDRVGLLVGDATSVVTAAVFCLDATDAAIDFAIDSGANLIIAHHPLVWNPMKRVVADDHVGAKVLRLAQSGISLIAAHTNWDACPDGLNDWLAATLGLSDIRPCGSREAVPMAKVVIYVPQTHTEHVTDALAAVGVGSMGNYDRCAFSVEGKGTFRPGVGTTPFIGHEGEIEVVAEDRIEMLLRQDQIEAATRAIRGSHPYEEPAFDFIPTLADGGHRISRIGGIMPMTLAEFANHVDHALSTRGMAFGNPEEVIQRVAVCGGAACDEWRAVQAAGAQVLVTGEVKHATAVEATDAGFAIIAAGHYATEGPSMKEFAKKYAAATGSRAHYFEPVTGFSGRPIDR